MKKKMKITGLVFLGLVLLVIVASALIYNYGVAGKAFGCRMLGGRWTSLVYSDKPHCLLQAKDYGKECTDSDQCQGACIGSDDLRRGEMASGTCSKYTEAIGCFTAVEDGKADLSICVD